MTFLCVAIWSAGLELRPNSVLIASDALSEQRNTLGLLYAQLELQSELLRAVTPFYQTYTLQPLATNKAGWASVMGDKSKEAVAIRKMWKAGSIWHTVC